MKAPRTELSLSDKRDSLNVQFCGSRVLKTTVLENTFFLTVNVTTNTCTALKFKYAELYKRLIHFKYDNNNRCLFSKLCKASDVWCSTAHAKSEGLLRFETSNGNSSNGVRTFCSHLYLLSCCILKSQRWDLVLVWESDSHLHLENADLLYYTSSEI